MEFIATTLALTTEVVEASADLISRFDAAMRAGYEDGNQRQQQRMAFARVIQGHFKTIYGNKSTALHPAMAVFGDQPDRAFAVLLANEASHPTKYFEDDMLEGPQRSPEFLKIPDQLGPLIEPRLAAAQALLPMPLRMLAFALATKLACFEDMDVIDVAEECESAHQKHTPQCYNTDVAWLAEQLNAWTGTASGHRNLLRVGNRALYLLEGVVMLFKLLDRQLQKQAIERPEQPRRFEREAATKALLKQHLSCQTYTTTSLGTSDTLSSGDQGVKYLTQMLNKSGNAYNMPADTDSQYTWRNWFLKLKEMNDHYDISDTKIIHTVCGHYPYDHKVLAGWREVTDKLTAQGDPVTLDEFERFVIRQLFTRSNMRRTSFEQLKQLPSKLDSMTDCHTLSLRLTQIVHNLFPEDTVELAPITHYDTCLFIQRMLVNLCERSVDKRKTALHHAWAQYNFEHKEIFNKWLSTAPCSEAASKTLLSEYSERIQHDLNAAQDMHNRVHGNRARPAKSNQQQVQAANRSNNGAGNASGSDQVNQSTQPQHKRGKKRKNGSDNRSGKRQASNDPAPHPRGSGGGQAHGTGRPLPEVTDFVRADRVEELERNRPPGTRLTDLVAAAGSPRGQRTFEQCIDLARRKCCVICRHIHAGTTTCRTIPPDRLEAVRAVAQDRSVLGTAAYDARTSGQPFDVALDKCGLPRLWRPS